MAKGFFKRLRMLLTDIGVWSSASTATAIKDRVYVVESESSGVPDELEISQLLDMAGIKGKEREQCFEVVGRIPVAQIVKSGVVTDRLDKMSCETSVAITVSNNTNRNWLNLVFLARIPTFLAEGVGEIEADCEMHAVQGASIAKFELKKVGALQSANFSYKVTNILSQAEANTIPLPVIINYKEGEPFVVTPVIMEEHAENAEKPVEKRQQ
ncbi:MAG: hypothetical protein Q8N60_03840 [Candidatus Diapherotrites archaeon]|nr:hypothetical protein [Candidatus Diapherotrites archaeon]